MEQHDLVLRQRTDAAIGSALIRLRGMAMSAELSRRTPAELRGACGFTRVMISSVSGSRWIPDTVRIDDHADPDAAEFDRFAQDGNEIPLSRQMLETDMVRHRVPVIVRDARNDPRTFKPLIRVTQSESYVAAPIMTNRRVIGFLHADRIGQPSEVTEGDLDSITLFASEFGVLFECATLRERIAAQRAQVCDVLDDLNDELRSLANRPMSPAAMDRTSSPWSTATRVDDHRPLRAEPLTDRERQVLDLVAAGATNQSIARELVLSVDTIKTHLRSIMRKLRASTRAEAVARYLQLRGPVEDRK